VGTAVSYGGALWGAVGERGLILFSKFFSSAPSG
jgi:hypothetical protein